MVYEWPNFSAPLNIISLYSLHGDLKIFPAQIFFAISDNGNLYSHSFIHVAIGSVCRNQSER